MYAFLEARGKKMNGLWVFDGNKKHNLNTLVQQLNTLLEGKKLVVARTETAGRRKPRPDSSWETMQDKVTVKKGSNPALVIPVKGWFDIPLKPFEQDGEKYASQIEIKGDHVTVYIAHPGSKSVPVTEITYTIT